MKIAYAFRNATYYPYHKTGIALPPPQVRGRWLKKVRKLGFEALELRIETLGGMDAREPELRTLGRELAEAGLPCVALRGGQGISPAHDKADKRRLVRKGIDIAQWLGARILNVTVAASSHTPGNYTGLPYDEGEERRPTEADFADAAQYLASLADDAAPAGVDISIELHHYTIVKNSASALKLLKMIDRPNVGVNPDIKNMYWTYAEPEESCEDAMVALAPHTNYWHCKNVTRVPLPDGSRTLYVRHTLADGEINYRFAVAALLDAGYDGYMAIEGFVNGDQLSIDGRSAAYARALIDEFQAERSRPRQA